MLTINGLLIVTCEIPIVNATQRVSHNRVVLAACLLIGGGIGAIAFAHSAWAVILTVVVWTVGEMLLFTILPTLYEEYAPAGARGAYMGAFAVAISGAFAIGAWLGIAALTTVGPVVMWSGCFVTAMLAALILTAGTLHRPDAALDFSDIPELTGEQLAAATRRRSRA